MSETSDNPNVQKAVAFFRQAGLSRLLAKLREKYIERGQVGGQVVLEASTPGERREIASFLGKAPYQHDTIKIRLTDIDHALRESGFACTLTELLSAFFPEQPLITRPEKRLAHEVHQHTFLADLQAIAALLPATSRGRRWLEQGQHGSAWLFSRYKNAPRSEQEQQLNIIRYVANVLDRLPGSATPQRLAIFAQQTSGDPHMLDSNRAAGRLFLLALNDLANASSSTSPQDRAQELRLYNDAGLLVDTISSSVAVFNLGSASSLDGVPDLWVQAKRVWLLPMRQLLAWRGVCPSQADIYVVENPQVFEEIIEGLQGDRPCPTLICTAGWPSVAALTLIDRLLDASPDNHIHYSGDFDLKGLQIAAHLQKRYSDRCHLWHLDPVAYTIALQVDGVPARASDLAQLDALPPAFAPLVASIQEQKKWAYQEGIAHLLSSSIIRYEQ